MKSQPAHGIHRREVLSGLTLAGMAGLLGLHAQPVAAEPPPETTRLRLHHYPAICYAPYYVAGALLEGEGFTDVQYVKLATWADQKKALAAGELDFTIQTVGQCPLRLDVGDPITVLAGLHAGCYELFATDRVRTLRDLKGKTVSLTSADKASGRYVFLVSMLAYVGLDPHKDITVLERPATESIQLLAAGQIDAFMAFPPEPQELRAKQIGHVLVDTQTDRPWSQYFCCMLVGRREFVQRYPVATKRWLRAIVKAAQVCALEPDQATQFLVDKGYTTQYDYALQAIQEIPYAKWREYDSEDSVRFHALRLHEVGMIKNSPQKLITQGTDWRFLNELKKELKG
jgi:NitT/TauT family transport system substrate-binding protein